jgi:hypothetical protein
VTDARTRGALRTLSMLALLLAVAGTVVALPAADPTAGLVLAAGGVALFGLRFVVPRALTPVAHGLHRALQALGVFTGDVVLTLVYLFLLWPYHALLVMVRAIPSPNEPWPPPPGTSGWTPFDAAALVRSSRHLRAGRVLARLAIYAGSAAALVRFLRRRPAYFLVPVVLLLLALLAIVLLGQATGLGPFIYTLF